MKPIKNPEEPLALWSGQDRIDNEIHTSVTAIIRSGGCSWNRCRICQYRHERFTGVEKPELSRLMMAQIHRLKEQIEHEKPQVVKVYTSGSFFDPAEVPPDIQEYLINQVKGKTLIVESRCEYVDLERFSRYMDLIREGGETGTIVVAIGLETTSDPIREKCIDKGLHFSEYLKTSDTIHKAGGKVKTYLLHKPPYLTEREAHDDMIRSIREIIPITDLISMNPCTVQRNTHLETLWKRQAYRPPYLWSVASILAQSDAHVTCDPIGGGQTRGPHNCGTCDSMILDAIRDYNLNADQDLMKSVMEMHCDCKDEWEYVMNQEYPWSMPLTR
ncbi:MAG TPA: archaeosine biosynthesis radical SAM protein RaSEA [Methanospirillum sp.]|uniref:archaeosine biosynthesis radical SAM protein RaSEA n=1 Tax=Methanospirillum sp. TaxID=45200 RepID=UPI002B6FBEB1|nr:archaeosine biosynthesis radical SAM protein RaSEA [Methanospirillum sp.]HOJ96470.1 archaeosine biosynthesis radical SAM protein RaSEA [Methanospirillum sp.]HOL40496.1 archaeosine biosynthesis radical SAM protein RaSEA [Methanospirillum sp.]